MRRFVFSGVIGLAMLAVGAARAANVCVTDNKLACVTTMPVGGFCECTAHGQPPQDGTVLAKAPPHTKINATAGGCGIHPNAPGCK